MSFLFKRKKIFLFVFIFAFLFFATHAFAQVENTNNAASTITDGGLDLAKGLSSVAIRLISPIVAVLGFIGTMVSGALLGIAAYLFDFSLQIGVYGISDIVNSDPSPIKDVWLIFRNIANIGIIFALLFIAIKTILQDNSYGAKALLGKVIVSALLMNFSFFFGAIVVDVSNEMSLTIYEEIANEVGKTDDGLKLGSYYFDKTGVSLITAALTKEVDPNANQYFVETLGVLVPGYREYLAWKGFENYSDKTLTVAVGFIMGTIVNLVLACVMFIAGFMIIGRLVAILILLVVAPIAFASNILPSTQQISKGWWGSLVGQSFYLPAFLLFIYVGIKITDKITGDNSITKKLVTEGSGTGATDLTATLTKIVAPMVFQFSIVIALFIAALIVAKKISSKGDATVGSISASVTSATGGAIAAGGALLGRNTIGIGADKLSKTEWAQRIGQTRIGSLALNQMKGVAKNSFDARESRAFKGVASATGVGGGFSKYMSSQKGGYIGAVERSEKRKVDRAKNLSDQLTESQKTEKETLNASIESDNQALQTMIDSDSRVQTYEKRLENYQMEFEAAKSSGDADKMKKINAQIKASQKGLEVEKARVKAGSAYTTILAKQTDSLKKRDSIISARETYAENLEKPIVGKWVPPASKSASDKIKKSLKLTDEDKRTNAIIAALRESK